MKYRVAIFFLITQVFPLFFSLATPAYLTFIFHLHPHLLSPPLSLSISLPICQFGFNDNRKTRMAGDPSCTSSRVDIPTPSSCVSFHTLPSDSISIPIDPPAQVALTHDRHASRRQFHHSHPQHQPTSSEPLSQIQIHTSHQQQQLQNTHNNTHGQHDATSSESPLSPATSMTAQTTSLKDLLLTDLRPLSNQETQRSTRHPSNRDSCETLKPSRSNLFSINEIDTQEQQHRSRCFEDNPSVSPKPRLCRHPSRLRGSRYTRFFGFERGASTQSQVVVRSPWMPTGALFVFRLMLFVYGFAVLATDLARTERPRYSFCYLTQLSYLGLVSYLGVSF